MTRTKLVDQFVRLKSRDLGDAIVYRRKVIHLANAVLTWPLLVLDRGSLIAACGLSAVLVVATQRRVPYASAALLVLLAFASQTAIAGAWLVFTVGDGSAGIAGRFFSSRPLPGVPEKSVAGTSAFVLCSSIALFVFLLGSQVSVAAAAWITVGTVVIAGSAEAWLRGIDDNFTVLVTSGVVLDVLLRVA